MPSRSSGESTPVDFSQGLADNPNAAVLKSGELQLANGCEYRLGKSSLFKQPGRTIATTSGIAVSILGIHKFQYNGYDDVFVAIGADGHIYEATPGTSMTFTDVMVEEEFDGTGQNTLSGGGTFSGTEYALFEVEIDGNGTPDTFRWRKDGGSWTSGVGITGGVQALSDGIVVTFNILTTGYTIGDKWFITAIPTMDTSAQPQFSTYSNRWILTNGVDEALLREAQPASKSGSYWRVATMVKPAGAPVGTNIVSVGSNDAPDFNTGSVTDPSFTVDQDLDTKGLLNSTAAAVTHTWTFSTNQIGTDRGVYIVHNGQSGSSTYDAGIDREPLWGEGAVRRDNYIATKSYGDFKWEYRYGGSGLWTELFFADNSNGYNRRTDIIQIPDGTDLSLSNLEVRATVDKVAGQWIEMQIFEIGIRNGRTTSTNVLHGIYWGITEIYVDSNGVEFESGMSPVSNKFAPGAEVATYGASVDLSGITTSNVLATKWRIYRSLDVEGGGWPNMFRIGEIEKGTTVFVDDFEEFSLTSALDKPSMYKFITIVYPDGATFPFDAHQEAPDSKMMMPFQGSMAIIPLEDNDQDKLFYSMPYSIEPSNGVFVPSVYYLRFDSAKNDKLTSMQVCNGGRSLIVYADAQAHLVNYLPQASDPGRFDQRAKEKVSTRRGCAGRLASTVFSPDEGVTEYAAAVDSLGLWITDGVGILKNWSKDIDFATHFASADLTTAQLVDNPEKRRLELLYDSDSGGTWKRILFFYGEMKTNGMPKITGPDAAGYRCITYSKVSGDWVGWSGDDGADGEIFNEETGVVDASQSNGVDNNILFDVQTKDFYPYQLKSSGLVIFLYLKFDEPSVSKAVSVVATCTVEAAQASKTSTRNYDVLNTGKMLIRKYGTRFDVRVTDNTNTALPAMTAGEITSRPLTGEGADTPAVVP